MPLPSFHPREFNKQPTNVMSFSNDVKLKLQPHETVHDSMLFFSNLQKDSVNPFGQYKILIPTLGPSPPSIDIGDSWVFQSKCQHVTLPVKTSGLRIEF